MVYARFSQPSYSGDPIVYFDRISLSQFEKIPYFEVIPKFKGIDFGNVRPGTTDNLPQYYIDTNDVKYQYSTDSLEIEVLSSSDYNISAYGTPLSGPGGATISVNNLKIGVNAEPTIPPTFTPLSTSEQVIESYPSSIEKFYVFLKLDVPSGTTLGSYSGSLTIKIST